MEQVTEVGPGQTWQVECYRAYVRDGCVVYVRGDQPDRMQHVPVDTLFAFVIDRDPAADDV